MNSKLFGVLLWLCCINCFDSFAQVKPVAKDSTKLYQNIEKYSKKRKFTKTLHKFIFEPVAKKTANPIRKPKKRDYKKYEGKIVRDIIIETLDPFGYSVNDTAKKPKNWAERSGNAIHLKSKEFAIRNLLLVKKNKPLDTLLVSETERLIRTQRYISQVKITIAAVSRNSDSVDINIRVLDSWSLLPKASFSTSRASAEINERNFFGFGHGLDTRYTKRFEDEKSAFLTRYTIPNYKNTYISTTVLYYQDLNGYFGKSINVERPFFSAFTRWAGGIYIDQQFRRDSLQNANMDFANQNLKYTSQDVWGAHSFQIFKGNTERERTSNLIMSARFLNTQFQESPAIEFDSINYYSGEKFVMAGIGISSRQYVEDEYLFNYGIIEDVPVGKVYGITGGYQIKNGNGRFYTGARASFGNYFKWGYLSTNFEVGTFFNEKKLEQSAISFQANYFTNLLNIGDRWKMRQFIKPQIIIGTNRVGALADRLTINESSGFQGENGIGFQGPNVSGIRGFNSALYGTKKFVLSLQTQFYSPWDLWGFRINPYFNYSAAMLGTEGVKLTKSKLFSAVGIGIIISNDYLVFNSFQLSLAYYPNIPSEGYNLFKTNSFETTDFGFQDFEYGKPRTVLYR